MSNSGNPVTTRPASGREARERATPALLEGLIPEPIWRDPNPGILRSALHVVYDLAWLSVILLTAIYWIPRCFLDSGFRHMAGRRLGFFWPDLSAPGRKKRLLVHGVSVGEVKAAQSLVRELGRRYPDLELVISTTTNTGEKVARDAYPDLRVVRFPVDLSFIVKRFLRRIAPDCVVLIELEIWPNFLRQANCFGIPVCVVNGRITESSFGLYRHFRNLTPQFNRITLFSAQDEDYARRFRELAGDGERIVVSGNIKVDGLQTGRVEPAAALRELLGPREGQLVVVAGSTHAPEERWITQAWREAAPETRLILVPRHPERARELVTQLASDGVAAQRLTDLRAGSEAPDPSRPVLVDTIGELEQVYGLSDLVFIGGSLVPHGGQNMLEPAAQERAVLYGPHVRNFTQEAALLEKAGAAQRLEGQAELGPVMRALLDDPEARARMGRAGIEAVVAQKGATEITIEALSKRCLDAVLGPA